MTSAPTGAVVFFTRDLRVHDHPGLDDAARRFERVAPLFVFDDRVLRAHASPNRVSSRCSLSPACRAEATRLDEH